MPANKDDQSAPLDAESQASVTDTAPSQESEGQAPAAGSESQPTVAEDANGQKTPTIDHDLEAREAELEARALGTAKDAGAAEKPADDKGSESEQQQDQEAEPKTADAPEAKDDEKPGEERWHPEARSLAKKLRGENQALRKRMKAAESVANNVKEAVSKSGLNPERATDVIHLFGRAVNGDQAAVENLGRIALECGWKAPEPAPAQTIDPAKLDAALRALNDLDTEAAATFLRELKASSAAPTATAPATRPATAPATRPATSSQAAPQSDGLEPIREQLRRLDAGLRQAHPQDYPRLQAEIVKEMGAIRLEHQQDGVEVGAESAPVIWRTARDRVLARLRQRPAARPPLRPNTSSQPVVDGDDLQRREADLDRRAGVRG